MPTNSRGLDRRALREHLTRTAFQAPPSGSGLYGIEVELFPLRWQDGDAHPAHVPVHGPGGSLELVQPFADRYQVSTKTPEGDVLVTDSIDNGRFTFEPGGQVEFSGAPKTSPANACQHSGEILEALTAFAADRGISILTTGFNPWQTLDEIGLNTDAARYQTMDAVYQSIGPFGRRMMRQSATIHVNLDLGDPDRALKRWRAAQLLAPIAIATFAYSPYCEGQRTGFASFRGRVWTEVDPSRCGFPRGFLDDSHSDPIDQYFQFALNARVLAIDHDGASHAQTTPLPFARWLDEGVGGTTPSMADWENHLTTLFPEVRPRGFFELRSADAQARPFRSVPLSWWTSLLCDDTALEAVLERLDGTGPDLLERYLEGARHGARSPLLGHDVATIFKLAVDATPRFEPGFFADDMVRALHAYGDRFALRGRSPADDLLDASGETPMRGAFAELEQTWSHLTGLGSSPLAGPYSDPS